MMGKENNPDSESIVKHIPQNTVGAEVGVWAGNSSKRFLDQAKPKHLHLVDPWSKEPYKQQAVSEHKSYSEYLKKYKKLTGGTDEASFDAYYDKMHKRVTEKFSKYNNVTIHRMWSTQFFDTFNGKLDWIYIDGDHSYKGCYTDLVECLKVMQPNCLIFGDDYAWVDNKGKPGVTKAVDRFVNEKQLEIKRLGNRQYMIRIKNA